MYNHQSKDYSCVVCDLIRGAESSYNKTGDIIYKDEQVIAYISPKWWPNIKGNVMILPIKHVENIYDISEELLCSVNLLAKKIALAMKATYKCDGISFRQHNEPGGNQDLWHFHMHVFPRWENDNLYQNHNQAKYVSHKERLPFANLLRNFLSHN